MSLVTIIHYIFSCLGSVWKTTGVTKILGKQLVATAPWELNSFGPGFLWMRQVDRLQFGRGAARGLTAAMILA